MADDNFFAAPQADHPVITDSTNLVPSLREMDFKRLKKLYYRSCNVSAIAGLLIISVVVLSGVLIFMSQNRIGDSRVMFYIMTGATLFSLVTTVGVILRTHWGRIMGIINCAFMCINLSPLAIIIGIVGLVAFISSPHLFGPNRLTHADLKKEFKHRKKNGLL